MDVIQERVKTMEAISAAGWTLRNVSWDTGADDLTRLPMVADALARVGADLLTAGRDLRIALSGWEPASE
ncbi:MAG: hypothetical protein ACHP9Z_11765 [Streptosporangiales bacterium]